jgi:sigma-B regulation protein RsbU (phosphoserine phosphatase)
VAERSVPDERLRRVLDDFSLAGLRYRLVLVDGSSETILHDGLGAVAADAPEETWPVAEDLTMRVAFAESSQPSAARLQKLLASQAPETLRMEREVLFYSRELAGRYGEVDLLTSVGETLGSGIVLERGVTKLLAQLVNVTDGSGAELWTLDDDESQLARFAASTRPIGTASIDLKLSRSPLAEVYRSGMPRSTTAEDLAEILVPVRRSPGHGLGGPMGVLRVWRSPSRMFRHSDLRLVTAIASQIGAAFENRRLIGESVERERMLVELELAHHLQLKLLPQLSDFSDCADIAARCEPAESVGGDFYHLFRLGDGRLGVMLGDVSSHGYSAGLIMALTMSAASLVVQDGDRPGDVLRGIHRELVRKLESTEMYMTLCYVVLDPRRNLLRYANAGHPHAFRVGSEVADRLDALNPPLGIAEFDAYEERELSWFPGKDILLLFTDGLSETIREDQLWSDDIIIETVRKHLAGEAGTLLEELFTIASPGQTPLADDRTALVVK